MSGSSGVNEVADFLLARIAEDRAAAEAADGQFGVYPDTWWGQPGARPLDINEVDAAFIARHEPARVLRDCKAKAEMVERWRLIIESFERREAWPFFEDVRRRERSHAQRQLAAFAEIYADHPDYDEAWRP